jgi:hypothetical protein
MTGFLRNLESCSGTSATNFGTLSAATVFLAVRFEVFLAGVFLAVFLDGTVVLVGTFFLVAIVSSVD